MHSAVSAFYPDTRIDCCRFHLGQCWWRKIPALGLSRLYKDKSTEEGKWLSKFFGLSFLEPQEIRVITKLPNSEQSSKRKVKTHKYINRQNQSTTGKLGKP